MSEPNSSISVIIPALNEVENIRGAVDAAREAVRGRFRDHELLLFNDASTDGTGEVMDALARGDSHARVVHNETRQNIGGIYRQGLRAARGEYITYVPGDNENPTEALVKPYEAVGRADVIVPYTINGHERGMRRDLVSRTYTGMLNLLLGLDLPYYNGTAIYRTAMARRVDFRASTAVYHAELLSRVLATGASFLTVGIRVDPTKSQRPSQTLTRDTMRETALVVSQLALRRFTRRLG